MDYDLVICGGGAIGLVAACALSSQFERIAIVDARHLGSDGAFRRSVAHANHVHHLLAGGQDWLDAMVPYMCDELISYGAQRLDYSGEIAVLVGNLKLPQIKLGFTVLSMSRSLLDQALINRVNQIENIQVLDGCMIDGVSSKNHMINKIYARNGARRRVEISGKIFVDCTGASLSQHWFPQILRPNLYYDCPVNLAYASFRAFSPDFSFINPMVRGLISNPTSEDPRFLASMPIENNEVMVTVGTSRLHSEVVMLDPRAEILEICRDRQIPIDWKLKHSLPRYGQRKIYWRRFNVDDGLPLNYYPMGDFVCQLTPLSGQGITLGLSHALAMSRIFDYPLSASERQEKYLFAIEQLTKTCWISALSRQSKVSRFESGNSQFESEVDALLAFERAAVNDEQLRREYLARRHFLCSASNYLGREEMFHSFCQI